jgi:hypothetical protein
MDSEMASQVQHKGPLDKGWLSSVGGLAGMDEKL